MSEKEVRDASWDVEAKNSILIGILPPCGPFPEGVGYKAIGYTPCPNCSEHNCYTGYLLWWKRTIFPGNRGD